MTHKSKQTWSDRFRAGLVAHEKSYLLNNLENFKTVQDSVLEPDLVSTGICALANVYAEKATRHVEHLTSKEMTPIEMAMLFALAIGAFDRAQSVRFRIDGEVFGDFEDMPDCLLIEPQAQLGQYRVDFLLEYSELIPDFDHPVTVRDGRQLPGSKVVTSKLIVECDGHDFHERTKEQASKDRRRDRELQKIGYKVFRFTGADIWKDVLMCAREAISHVTDLEHEWGPLSLK